MERRHAVFQDRFVKALRLRKIDTLEAANAYLNYVFLDALNEQFHAAARSKVDLHRSVSRGVRLEHVLCYQEERVVQNDWTASWCNRVIQINEPHRKLPLARKQILVSELLDGTLRLTRRGRELSWTELPARPSKTKPRAAPQGTTTAHKPAANHPWRRPFLG